MCQLWTNECTEYKTTGLHQVPSDQVMAEQFNSPQEETKTHCAIDANMKVVVNNIFILHDKESGKIQPKLCCKPPPTVIFMTFSPFTWLKDKATYKQKCV